MSGCLHARSFCGPAQLWDLPLQVIAWPWLSRSALMASRGLSSADPAEVNRQITEIIIEQTNAWLEEVDPSLPVVLTAHASVEGAVYGSERTVMLGSDWLVPASLVRDPRLDYVALGHIHKPQDLNQGAHPPVIYPGSIERVDFGEASDPRYFVIADVSRGATRVRLARAHRCPALHRTPRLAGRSRLRRRAGEQKASPTG